MMTLGEAVEAFIDAHKDDKIDVDYINFGFGSVAKYTAVSIREAGFDLASMCKTSTKVFSLPMSIWAEIWSS